MKLLKMKKRLSTKLSIKISPRLAQKWLHSLLFQENIDYGVHLKGFHTFDGFQGRTKDSKSKMSCSIWLFNIFMPQDALKVKILIIF